MIATVALAASVIGAIAANDDQDEPELSPLAAVTDPADGCRRFLDLTVELINEKAPDGVANARYAQLQREARANDVLLASDLQDIRDADNAADVSAASQIIMRRCVAAGHLTQSDLQRLVAAGLEVMGDVPSPAQQPVEAPVQAPVDVEDETEYVESLSAGEPPCAEVLPMLQRHPQEIREWLESFEGGGVAGTPWEADQFVTLYSLSPETGDPIRQTFTAGAGLLDDYDLSDEPQENVPNRVLIYLEDGALKCADGP